MTIYESDLPGVGKKFEIELDDDTTLVIVIHNTGKRELFRREGDDDSVKLFELSDKMSRQIGTILEGAYFQPIATDTTETMLDDDSLLEWVRVVESAEIVGQTLEELDFRVVTGASVVAIQRNDDTESNPGPETTIRADDTLIVIGTREACNRVETLAAGDRPDPADAEDGDPA
jgi:TrkA domain protein